MMKEVFSILIIVLTTIIVRVILLLKRIQQERELRNDRCNLGSVKYQKEHKHKRNDAVVTLVVLGSGGHTTEMMSLLSNMNPERYKPIIHVIASTDHTSETRVKEISLDTKIQKASNIYRIPRSREVGQSYLTSIFSTTHAFIHAFRIVWTVKPDLVLCNGPGTCLPIVLAAFILGNWRQILFGSLWKWKSKCLATKIIFVESFCRVKNLSLTGKLLYPIADCFVVHWEELHAKYPKSVLVETFVRR